MLKVAIAQAAPVLLDRAATTERAVSWIGRAAEAGAKLVCFGETFLPGYPVWMDRIDGARFDADEPKALHAAYVDSAVNIGRGDLDPVRDAARSRGVAVVIGIAETDPRRGRSVFATCVSIGPDGEIRAAHRKLMPTYEERLAWGAGDAHGLRTWALGPFTVGALNCWENWMPLPRAALHAQGETLHVAIWPGSARITRDVTRFIAREGRSYVLSASSIIRASDLPSGLPHRGMFVSGEDEIIQDGGSCIAGPDGNYVVEPVTGEERLIVAELDPAFVDRERQNFDPAGHYSRPELLRLTVDRRRAEVSFDDA